MEDERPDNLNDDDLLMMDEDEDELTVDEQAMFAVENTIDRFMSSAGVEAVYGEPVERGDTLIIPAAEVGAVLGFGVGSGYSTEEKGGAGSGGGGGGWNFSRPVAVIVASPEGVRVEPVIDVTKVGIAALTTFGFMAALVLRMLRPRR